jgi:hypothetical protein
MIEKMNKVVSRCEDLEISGSHSASRRLMLLTLETDLYFMNRDGSTGRGMTDDKQLYHQVEVHYHQSIDRSRRVDLISTARVQDPT